MGSKRSGTWRLRENKYLLMFVISAKIKLLLARYNDYLSLHELKFLTQTFVIIFSLITMFFKDLRYLFIVFIYIRHSLY